MYYVIVDCIDMEDGYQIPDKEGIDILKEYHETKDIKNFEKKFKEYAKKFNDVMVRESLINLIKHLLAAKRFGWNCNFLVKKIDS